MAEKIVLVATRKEVGGWPEAGKRGVSRSVPSTVEARGRSMGLLGTLQ